VITYVTDTQGTYVDQKRKYPAIYPKESDSHPSPCETPRKRDEFIFCSSFDGHPDHSANYGLWDFLRIFYEVTEPFIEGGPWMETRPAQIQRN